ncbi:uncharacterized protein ASPGLDRAFT_133139 [Aspergillus glaucus CBS 516.65]|uniref:Transmembrane protein 135 N-terminal domain-containing protein n=1 Tax=Aspergillus glaucus CBS 516.65 TaxID=1160497 RepID=A0A1L9VBE6_ASPGL|nr:hypothetical protein ASPGLDRAFT_133139 [Aspergillus glaucus CBS 516.65]OJJ81234.1 hypothetical protein ASPGLDRAFT_133139 [Aspergillus glaucus CBS 516.65]
MSADPTVGVDPALRALLRLSLSSQEYKLLHERAPAAVKKNAPSPARFEAIVRPKDKYNDAAIRESLRVFVGSGLLLKLVEVVSRRMKGGAGAVASKKRSIIHSPNFRLPLALALVVFFHRRLHRLFARIRASLRIDKAQPFRERNPRLAKALTSRYAPAVGGSLAGFALGIAPQAQLRMTAAIYMSTRTLEFLYNVIDEKGWLKNKPWWFGSWLLMPVSCAQLFHAFVFDRETVPKWFGKVVMNSPSYIQSRPALLPAEIPWPENEEVVDSLGSIANLRWPPFTSPILHPSNPNTLPAAIKSIAPITGPAHPSISSLSCALLHPAVPSCNTAFLHHILLSVPRIARFMTTVMLAISILKYKSFKTNPLASFQTLAKRIFTLTAVLSTSIGSAWGSLCLWNTLLSRSALPTKRFFLSGALGGLPFAFLGNNSRSAFMSIFRSAVDSAWKSGVKRGLWKGWTGGELGLIVVSWAVMGAILERRPGAVQAGGLRKGLAWLRGDGFLDPVEVLERKRARRAARREERELGEGRA